MPDEDNNIGGSLVFDQFEKMTTSRASQEQQVF